MCGIVGIVNISNNDKVDQVLLERMTGSLFHRGPDAEGIYLDNRIGLGHRRLKIIDLSEVANQPMFDLREQVGIVFNGEIYNYREIRQDLISKGYAFKSSSDTEVILNSYLEYGIDCINIFSGMFAFAIYDKRDGRVFIVRDRLGVKPLYYSLFDGRLTFSSEIKAILMYPKFTKTVNMIGISSYLSYRYPLGENTFFEGINSLLPGHYLEIKKDTMTLRQYWHLSVTTEKEDLGEDFYTEKIRKLLFNSISCRMISDVPLGAYLSGGLDSSVLVALMSKINSARVKTFSIGFAENGFNEFHYARLVADRYNTEHREILLNSSDYIDNMLKLIKYKDGPLAVPNEPALYVMSKELKKYITVVLSGEGADELFGGYGRIFRSPYDYERLKILNSKVVSDYKDKDIDQNMIENLQTKYGNKTFKNEVEHFFFLYEYIKWDDKLNLLSNDLIQYLDNDRELKVLFLNEFEKLDKMSIYDKYMWIFEKFHIVGLLHRLDTATMATSVEGRVPFVDHHELVDFVMAMPFAYKIRWKSVADELMARTYNCDQISERYDIPKYILKRTFENDLPAEVVWREKVGFPVPVHRWFGNEFNNFAKDILLDDTSKKRGIFNSSYIAEIVNNENLFENHSLGVKVWMLLNLELWFREYID